jgi:hypothetical protein
MTTYLTTGYTPELTTAQKCRNLLNVISAKIGPAAAFEMLCNISTRPDATTDSVLRELTGIARSLVAAQAQDASPDMLADGLHEAGFGSGGIL